jgi:hypothetical protein
MANNSTSARALLLVAFFGAGAVYAHAASSCVDCHGDPATMQKLVAPPKSGGAEEGEG